MTVGPDTITVGGHSYGPCRSPTPSDLPWRELGDRCRRRVDGSVQPSARRRRRTSTPAPVRVVISAVADGRRRDGRDGRQRRRRSIRSATAIVSNASCTTNCVTPMAKVLDDAFGDRARLHDDGARLHGVAAGPRLAA